MTNNNDIKDLPGELMYSPPPEADIIREWLRDKKYDEYTAKLELTDAANAKIILEANKLKSVVLEVLRELERVLRDYQSRVLFNERSFVRKEVALQMLSDYSEAVRANLETHGKLDKDGMDKFVADLEDRWIKKLEL